MLLAGMGENYLRRHLFANEAGWGNRDQRILETFRKSGIDMRDYDPATDVVEPTPPGTEPPSAEISTTDGPAAPHRTDDSDAKERE